MGETYWVGKKTMKNIKQLAIKEFMNNNDVTSPTLKNTSLLMTSQSSSQFPSSQTDSCTNSNGDTNNNKDTPPTTTPSAMTNTAEITTNKNSSTPSNKNLTRFNQDIVCQEHGRSSVHLFSL